VVANVIGGTASVLVNNGDGTFRAAPDVDTGGLPDGFALAFIDQDSNLDLIATSESAGRANVFHGNGDGTFAAPIGIATAAQPIGVAVGDLTGNGRLDLVIANYAEATLTIGSASCLGP